ncbi:MAG: hypothetical protein M3Q98_04855 [Actinomycetota bacterium]|nr:hypothetical protein [Actinomycetota bacterium]
MPDNPELAHLLARAIAAVDPTIEKRIDSDPQANLDLVVIANEANVETGKILNSAVSSARAAGWSWEAVGNALGMSRQAAQQRFGLKAEEAESNHERQRLVGLTATNEMEVLNAKGRQGWHSVGYGPLFHDLEKSDVQWEHRRVFVGSRKAKRLESGGWERIGTMWFPWHYFKKQLGLPAEDED